MDSPDQAMEQVDVLVIGAGPVGLTLALDFAWRGRKATVIERDAGTAVELLAKAGTLNERTMEFCRRWGIAEEVANSGFPHDYPRDTVYCTSLTGHFIGRDAMPATKDRGTPLFGPEMLRKCGQFLFDPILVNAIKRTGLGDLRYNTEFRELTQDATGVTVTVVDTATGATRNLRANYVVACDGAGSRVRKQLNIGLAVRPMDYSISVMLRIDQLERFHRFGRCERFMFMGPSGTWANITAVDGLGLWRMTLLGYDERIHPDQIDLVSPIKKAFGRDDIPFEMIRALPWWRAQSFADTFRVGRVLLAGDACHTTSPTGGHGLNTGIGDSITLSWMLDALLSGWGGPALLDAYTIERRPVATRNTSSSTDNYNAWADKSGCARILDNTPEAEATRRNIGARISTALKQEWQSHGIGMGYRYEGSPIVVPDGTPEPPDPVSDYVQTARPGHRAPHAWLPDGRSTIDLFGTGFVLLRFDAALDVAAIVTCADGIGLPFSVVDIIQDEIAALYRKPLVLVRPDGHVAWRGDVLPSDIAGLLDHVRGMPVDLVTNTGTTKRHEALVSAG